jgi:hypothetical protein
LSAFANSDAPKPFFFNNLLGESRRDLQGKTTINRRYCELMNYHPISTGTVQNHSNIMNRWLRLVQIEAGARA